jgi:hypothetical protein
MKTSPPDDYDPEQAIDREAIDADIAAGARAYTKLLRSADDDWTSWSIIIIGLRGLRDLTIALSGSSDIGSFAYRQRFGELVKLKKYRIYDEIGGKRAKQVRSIAYKLMDSIEQIDTWYAGLPPEDKLRWKHPESIIKHCPKAFVGGGRGGNRPKRQRAQKQKKPQTTVETERLRALLIQVIKLLMKHEPEKAQEFLDQIMPQAEPDPDDDISDIGGDDDDDGDDDEGDDAT